MLAPCSMALSKSDIRNSFLLHKDRKVFCIYKLFLYRCHCQNTKRAVHKPSPKVDEGFSLQPTAEYPSGMYLRRTARLMDKVSNQLLELKRRYAELEEVSRLVSESSMPASIGGIEPILYKGNAWYPLKSLLLATTEATNPKVEQYTKSYPGHTLTLYQVAHCLPCSFYFVGIICHCAILDIVVNISNCTQILLFKDSPRDDKRSAKQQVEHTEQCLCLCCCV